MYGAPPELQTKVFATVPPALQIMGRSTEWLEGRFHGVPTSFLEGPSFDREGNLYCVDIPYGRVFRVSPDGVFSVVVEYDGEPNGLKIHKDGRIFIADQKRGLMVLDPKAGMIEPFLTRVGLEGLKGPNDLVFASNGDLYFTDQGQTGWQDPTGRLIRIRADGRVEVVLRNIPSPNGLVFTPDETTLYLAVTRANAVWRVPLFPNGGVGKVGTFIQLSGGGGPDGLAIDEEGNLAICHSGLGSVWLFSKLGEPLYRIRACTGGRSTTNLAYGGPDRKTLYITESSSGAILTADLDVPGRLMYSHMN
jgi:gluconolactonase